MKLLKFTKRSLVVCSIIFIVLAIVGGMQYRKYARFKKAFPDEMSLEQAAKIGEVATHKLMVQIETTKGREDDVKARYQRGDIILVKPGDFEFSPAEKEGFLILKMDITDKQAEVLMRSLQKDTGKNDSKGNPLLASLARRRYSVDLSKLDILDGDEKGRELDKVYGWDILYEKNKN